MALNRRTFLALSAGAAASPAPRTPPNILFLFTDDQRFSTIRALGHHELHTPSMDRLVRRGTSFTHAAIMGASTPAVCIPSRAMLLSGQSLFHATDSIVAPRPGARPFTLFPELFRENGYRTFATGKWHNGANLFARCFTDGGDIFFGGMSDHHATPAAAFDPSGRYPASARRPAQKFSSELFSDAAIDFLNRHKGPDPFLAYVSYTSPHDPRTAPEKYAKLYPWQSTRLPKNFLPEHPFDNGELRVRDETLAPLPRTPDAVKQHIAAYHAMIAEVDAQIGRVLDALDRSPHAGNTIVVFAGDNGLAVGQHGLLGKQNLYDHSVRVPLVIAGPGIPAGRRVHTLCYLMDLYPTLCDLADIPAPRTVEGLSLAPAIQGRHRQTRDSLFLAYRDFQRGIRTDRWKLILYNVRGRQTTQLFDLAKDPLETRNLAPQNGYAARVSELRADLQRWMKEVDDPLDLNQPDWGRKPS